jgi:hypothetical protein
MESMNGSFTWGLIIGLLAGAEIIGIITTTCWQETIVAHHDGAYILGSDGEAEFQWIKHD